MVFYSLNHDQENTFINDSRQTIRFLRLKYSTKNIVSIEVSFLSAFFTLIRVIDIKF